MFEERKPPDVVRDPLPDHPDLALFVATLFERLGGRLQIDGQGRRLLHRPDVDGVIEAIPQLADARAGERFESAQEWRGAIRLVEYWLDRLGAADKERVFTALADVDLSGQPAYAPRTRR